MTTGKDRVHLIVLEDRTPGAVNAQHGRGGVLHGFFHTVVHASDDEIDEAGALDDGGVQTIDERLTGKQRVDVQALRVDVVDEGEGS